MTAQISAYGRLKAYHEQRALEHAAWVATGYHYAARPALTSFPDELRGMQCEAMTRAGKPCKRTDINLNGRCKYHGGMSTGARMAEGKARQREGYRRWLEGWRSRTGDWQ